MPAPHFTIEPRTRQRTDYFRLHTLRARCVCKYVFLCNISNPPHGTITSALKVRAYPVAEAHRAIWIWMGDPERANPAEIRNLSFLDDAPNTAFNKDYVHGGGHYQLFVDTILDLSHTDFLHQTSLGGGSITRTPAKVVEREDGIIAIHWHCMNETPIPLVVPRSPKGVDRVDGWTKVEWSAPGIMQLINGAVPAGSPRTEGGNAMNVHILTPETQSTTCYFFASTRDYDTGHAELNEELRQIRARASERLSHWHAREKICGPSTLNLLHC